MAMILEQLARDLTPVNQDKWKVSMRFSKSDDSFTRDQENKQYEMEFRSDYEEYKRRVNRYINNLIKAYAMIWERCTKGMKQKIEAKTDFHSNIEDNPIELLKFIKEHTQNFQENCYCMPIVLDSL
jgi:flavorubredoxin